MPLQTTCNDHVYTGFARLRSHHLLSSLDTAGIYKQLLVILCWADGEIDSVYVVDGAEGMIALNTYNTLEEMGWHNYTILTNVGSLTPELLDPQTTKTDFTQGRDHGDESEYTPGL